MVIFLLQFCYFWRSHKWYFSICYDLQYLQLHKFCLNQIIGSILQHHLSNKLNLMSWKLMSNFVLKFICPTFCHCTFRPKNLVFTLYFNEKKYYLLLKSKCNGKVFTSFYLQHDSNSTVLLRSSVLFIPFDCKIAYRLLLLSYLSFFIDIHLFFFSLANGVYKDQHFNSLKDFLKINFSFVYFVFFFLFIFHVFLFFWSIFLTTIFVSFPIFLVDFCLHPSIKL